MSEEWMRDLAKWLRGEAGRHMASIAPKGATITSHALQLRLWAQKLEEVAPSEQCGPAFPIKIMIENELLRERLETKCPDCGSPNRPSDPMR